MTVEQATKFITGQVAKMLFRLERKLDSLGTYKGFLAKSIARRVTGRAISLACGTVFCNAYSKQNLAKPRIISTRRWTTGKRRGRHCGYAAYWRPRGRPALPLAEAQRRARKRQHDRRVLTVCTCTSWMRSTPPAVAMTCSAPGSDGAV